VPSRRDCTEIVDAIGLDIERRGGVVVQELETRMSPESTLRRVTVKKCPHKGLPWVAAQMRSEKAGAADHQNSFGKVLSHHSDRLLFAVGSMDGRLLTSQPRYHGSVLLEHEPDVSGSANISALRGNAVTLQKRCLLLT
jgi:hypothetical protein